MPGVAAASTVGWYSRTVGTVEAAAGWSPRPAASALMTPAAVGSASSAARSSGVREFRVEDDRAVGCGTHEQAGAVLDDLDGLLRLPAEEGDESHLANPAVVVEQGGAVDEPRGLDRGQRRKRQDRGGGVRDGDGRSGGRRDERSDQPLGLLGPNQARGVGTRRLVPDEIPLSVDLGVDSA